jgi:hypothetical protein
MPMRWKLVGLAGLAGVAATGVVVARNRRPQSDVAPDELRDRLRQRLAEVDGDAYRTPTRSTTNTSVSSGPITPPAPRLP